MSGMSYSAQADLRCIQIILTHDSLSNRQACMLLDEISFREACPAAVQLVRQDDDMPGSRVRHTSPSKSKNAGDNNASIIMPTCVSA